MGRGEKGGARQDRTGQRKRKRKRKRCTEEKGRLKLAVSRCVQSGIKVKVQFKR
jgi:hypothetical protein